jgi:hypothetical protein
MVPLARRTFLAAAVCGCFAASGAVAQPSPSGKYVCPPCGCDMDGKVFDAPGECPAQGCGMTLIPQPKQEPPKSPTPPGGSTL